jgi:hypothetical protein
MAIVLKKPKPPTLPSVLIAIPCYTGDVKMLTMRSLLSEIVLLGNKGYRTHLIDEIGNGLIADVRAKFLARFLDEGKEFTHLVMIDDDVCWEPGGLLKLIEAGEDFVAGMYPRRTDPLTFNFRSAMEDGEGLTLNDKGLLEGVWGVPFGFVCLSRACCQKMVEAYEDLAFQAERGRDPLGNIVPGMKAWAVFDPYRVSETNGDVTKLGEDYAFCQRWRDIGGKVYVDPSIAMGHTGIKTFRGELGTWFEQEEVADAPATEEEAAA